MERIRWINQNGHQILLIDYSNLLENKYLRLIEEATDFQINQSKKELFVVYDLGNTRATPKVIKAGKKAVERLAKATVQVKIAMFGYNRMQRLIADIVKNDIYFATNMDDALKWLEKEAVKSQIKIPNSQ